MEAKVHDWDIAYGGEVDSSYLQLAKMGLLDGVLEHFFLLLEVKKLDFASVSTLFGNRGFE